MKRFLLAVAAVLALAMTPLLEGCAGQNAVVNTVNGPQSKVGAALATVTEVRELVAIAVTAGKIAPVDAENLRTQLNTARAGIDVAQGLYKDSPTGGDARLEVSRTAIAAVRKYLTEQGVKP